MKGYFKSFIACSLMLLAGIGTAFAAMPADNDAGLVVEQSIDHCQISHGQMMTTVPLILAPAQDMPIVAPEPDSPEAACLLISKPKWQWKSAVGSETSKGHWRSMHAESPHTQPSRPPGVAG